MNSDNDECSLIGLDSDKLVSHPDHTGLRHIYRGYYDDDGDGDDDDDSMMMMIQ